MTTQAEKKYTQDNTDAHTLANEVLKHIRAFRETVEGDEAKAVFISDIVINLQIEFPDSFKK